MTAVEQDAGAYWRKRGQTHSLGPQGWANHYWQATEQPHRPWLVQAVRTFEPTSILEIGCNAGPNLRNFRKAFPAARLTGIDINRDAITYARKMFGDDQMVQVYCDDIRTSEAIGIHDVVVSCYTLAYVRPDLLPRVLGRMLGLARRGLVLAEPMVTKRFPIEDVVDDKIPEWRHDYVGLLSSLGEVTLQERDPIDNLNALLILRRP